MYEELIKRLRNRRICIQQSGSLDDFPLLREAADAIEKLEKENERLHDELGKEIRIIAKLRKELDPLYGYEPPKEDEHGL